MTIVEGVRLALEALTKQDVRDAVWRGCFGVPAITVKYIYMYGERPSFGGGVLDDYKYVEMALGRLEQEGTVRRCENELWRLS